MGGGGGCKGTEKNGAPVWSTDTLDFVVFLNVLAPLDSDRIFSPKALAQRQRPAWGGVAGASCFAGEGGGASDKKGIQRFFIEKVIGKRYRCCGGGASL